MGYKTRLELYERLESDRDAALLVYVTGNRRGLETQISSEVTDLFVQHLDKIGVVKNLVLILHTQGGDTLAAWSLINLLQIYSDHLEIIVPAKAQSAGTLICLGADSITMTKQAALGPIDPSVNRQLNPQVPGGGANARVPVSVESVNGFIEFARETLGDDADLKDVYLHLATTVHPLVLGDAYRARGQIRMLASRLLVAKGRPPEQIESVLKFLCSESGSHDYTINRREAMNELGLPITKPNDAQYGLIKAVYDDIAAELELSTPFEPKVFLGSRSSAEYTLPRALIESRKGGSHVFTSEGTLTRQQVQVQPGSVQQALKDDRQFEGWRHHND